MRRLLWASTFLFLVSASLFAKDYRYWEVLSPGTNYIRYRKADTEEGGWQVLSQNGEEVLYVSIDFGHPFTFASSFDGQSWSKETTVYPPMRDHARALARKAGDNECMLSVYPYAYQYIHYDGESLPVIDSVYGWGGKLEGRIYTNGNVFIGTAASFLTYDLGRNYVHRYNNLELMPEIGFRQAVTAKADFVASLGFGGTLGIYRTDLKVYPGAALTLGLNYELSDRVFLGMNLEGKWHRQTNRTDAYSAHLFEAAVSCGAGWSF